MDNLAKDKTSKLLVKYSIPAIIAMLVTLFIQYSR